MTYVEEDKKQSEPEEMLQKFILAQDLDYETALREIKQGCKESHWMWYIFPQHKDLGLSDMAKYYGISSLDEAKQYLAHPILGRRLREISVELLKHNDKSAIDILGEIDALKLKSCMTLFDIIQPNDIFDKILQAFYDGKRDIKTISLLNINV